MSLYVTVFILQREPKFTQILKDIGISLLKNVFIILHILIEKAVEAFYSWLWQERKACVELRENFFVTKSATDIAEIIRKRELTAYHVVQAYINRLNEVGHDLISSCQVITITNLITLTSNR